MLNSFRPTPLMSKPALIDKNQRDREEDAPTERRRERDGRESVQHALDREQARVAGQAVLDRPEESERPDAEHDRRGHEAFRDAAAAAARREPTLERRAEGVQAPID